MSQSKVFSRFHQSTVQTKTTMIASRTRNRTIGKRAIHGLASTTKASNNHCAVFTSAPSSLVLECNAGASFLCTLPLSRFEHNSMAVPRGRRFSTRSKGSGKSVTLESTKGTINGILTRLEHMGNAGTRSADTLVLKDLLEEARSVLDMITFAVKQGQINPSGKHGKGVSDVMDRILRSYRRISTLSAMGGNDPLPCFEYCREALDTMVDWNLNFRHSHYGHAIVVANQEERWEDSANLFFEKIDPGAANNPVYVSKSEPEGLYAIARLAQQENSAVAELVFDAVLQLSMVSPQDQKSYILAAGTALGKAGEWEAAVEFLNSSYSAMQLGEPLISSVMHACLLSGRPDEALKIYEKKFGKVGEKSIAEEWQWGGNQDTADPLTADLLMRASVARSGLSTMALKLFQDTIKQGWTISSEALLGVLEACENDDDMESSLMVMERILNNFSNDSWLVPGSELSIPDQNSEDGKRLSGGAVGTYWLPQMSSHFACVLRCCNSQSSFGTGMYYLQKGVTMIEQSSRTLDLHRKTQDSTAGMLSSFEHKEELLTPMVVALCGMRCYDDAVQIFDSLGNDEFHRDTTFLREYAVSEREKNGKLILGNPWASASRHIRRLLSVLHFVRESEGRLTKADESKVLKCLAMAMQSCTSAHHSDLSLRLLSSVATSLQEYSGAIARDNESLGWRNLELESDFLSAEIIRALGYSNDPLDAIDVFHSLLSHQTKDKSKWPLSCSAGISVLVKLGRGDEAFAIFGELDHSSLPPDCLVQIGKYLLSEEKTQELGEIYTSALKNGNLSDELTIMTMSSIVKAKMDNRVRILRAMVDDNAKYFGIDRESWTRTRYWQVKKALGFFNARLLMWWNDAETCHLDELEFAIAESKVRKSEGLKVRNDAARTIVNSARLFDESTIPHDSFRWKNFVPRSKAEFVVLLLNLLEECESTPIIYDPYFVDSVVAAMRNLDANKDCVDFIKVVLDRDVRLQKSTLARALEAATIEQARAVVDDIRMLMPEISQEKSKF